MNMYGHTQKVDSGTEEMGGGWQDLSSKLLFIC